MEQVICPTFILHGQQDEIIPFEHSEELAMLCKGPTCLVISTEMTHCKLKYNDDFLNPFHKFLISHKVLEKEKRQFILTRTHANLRNSADEIENLDPTEMLKTLKQKTLRLD